jgi:hypothetical protein
LLFLSLTLARSLSISLMFVRGLVFDYSHTHKRKRGKFDKLKVRLVIRSTYAP